MVEYADAWHPLMNRGKRWGDILREDGGRRDFIKTRFELVTLKSANARLHQWLRQPTQQGAQASKIDKSESYYGLTPFWADAGFKADTIGRAYSPFDLLTTSILGRLAQAGIKTRRWRCDGDDDCLPTCPRAGFREGLNDIMPVNVIKKDVPPPVAPAHQMIHRPRDMQCVYDVA